MRGLGRLDRAGASGVTGATGRHAPLRALLADHLWRSRSKSGWSGRATAMKTFLGNANRGPRILAAAVVLLCAAACVSPEPPTLPPDPARRLTLARRTPQPPFLSPLQRLRPPQRQVLPQRRPPCRCPRLHQRLSQPLRRRPHLHPRLSQLLRRRPHLRPRAVPAVTPMPTPTPTPEPTALPTPTPTPELTDPTESRRALSEEEVDEFLEELDAQLNHRRRCCRPGGKPDFQSRPHSDAPRRRH